MLVAVVGGGPAGMAAAVAAKNAGADNVLLIERAERLGGVLPQCIHSGFGLNYYGRDLTGPEFAEYLRQDVMQSGIEVWLNAMVIEAHHDKTLVVSKPDGISFVRADVIIFAVGARERPRGAIAIPGTRPAGIFTAGTAQYMINVQGLNIGNDVFMLGSGDIGLITARRLTLEGAHVHGVAELMPFPGGLARNIQQCLKDYDIPLFLSHTVTEVLGKDRVEAVKVAQMENGYVVPGTEKLFPVDTLILSVGLLPEAELIKQLGLTILPYTGSAAVDQYFQTELPGVFVVGNGAGIWDLVDNVATSASVAGEASVKQFYEPSQEATLEPCGDIRVVLPQRIAIGVNNPPRIWFRVKRPLGVCSVALTCDGKTIARKGYASLRPAEMAEISLKLEQYNVIEPGDNLQLTVTPL
ncbi:NAD(P)/FAD-dependent oxidoreductase [Coprothermobacter platensis]|uniref:NAD(P)/FAD-dependent oxidoreductase n=1 Tax=Coprothermobacter platensis TaxID=108819 RepID=UPI00036B3D5F|nr:FAD-dependent oxidoreductase [Coprothermobacter platensis]